MCTNVLICKSYDTTIGEDIYIPVMKVWQNDKKFLFWYLKIVLWTKYATYVEGLEIYFYWNTYSKHKRHGGVRVHFYMENSHFYKTAL